MKKYLSLIHSFLILLNIFILSSCSTKEEIDLNGHWHVEPVVESNQRIRMIDINDSNVIINRNCFVAPPWGCKLGKENRIMARGNIEKEWETHFISKIKNDTLFIYDKNNNLMSFALKKNLENCNFESDYYLGKKIKIELPITNRTILKSKGERDLDLILGQRNKNSIEVELRKKIFDPLNIDKTKFDVVELENFLRINKRTNNRFFRKNRKGPYKIVIHADKNLPMVALSKLLKGQKEIEETIAYLVVKKDAEVNHYTQLGMIELNEIILQDSLQSIQEWLN